MNKRKLEVHRRQLDELASRLGSDISALVDNAQTPTGGQAAGNLSNAPMHLGDMGTEVYLQELNATLLENEEYLRGEVVAAMERMESGTYGACENCGRKILEERLDLLPYTRFCTRCAEKLQSGKRINLNEGRPGYDDRLDAEPGESFSFTEDIAVAAGSLRGRSRKNRADIHAAGTAGGGTAEGGLAGTNLGNGDPDNADLEDAMGSGTHDVTIAGEDDDAIPYAGRSGGAVGGTPAGKRAAGGRKTRGGIVPGEDPDHAESG